MAPISEVKLITRLSLQIAIRAANMAMRSMATAVMMRLSSWLSSSEILEEVRSMVEDLPFECVILFRAKMNESLHSLNVS